MASATFTFGGRSVRIDGPAEVIELTRGVLAYHQVPDTPGADLTLSCVLGEEPDLSDDTWTVPRDILRGDPNWFFYYGFAVALHRTWTNLGLIPVHGGLLVEDDDTAILVVGNRHDGKSSTAAGWLDEGGRLAGDDTALLDGPLVTGFLRELHLDRELAPLVPRLRGITEARPYLPGRPRVAYDWVGRFPGQVVAKPLTLRAVVRTRVDRAGTTAARELRADFTWEGRRLGVPAWEVTWGPDIWTSPGKHRHYLRRLLGVGE